MCGIAGYVTGGEVPPDAASVLGRMTDSLAPRGPDGRGTWLSEDGRVGLGHRRLAILDLSEAGAQPMVHEEAGLVVTFNGEIYNHLELREKLAARGVVFRSGCDTETLLHAFAAWGPAVAERLRGIFAYAVLDIRNRRLHAARDHLGVKPFCYWQGGGSFLFASQPRAFLPWPGFGARIDRGAFLDYLAYGVVPGAGGIFEGMEKLPPGHRLTLEGGHLTTERFWQVPETGAAVSRKEARERVEASLRRVVGRQLLSDVPVATFLSGGIDSSIITAMAAEASDRPIRSYTIGFDKEASDERAYAKLTAGHAGTKEVVGVLTPDDAERCAEDVVEAYDEPFGIGAGLPMVAISRLASEDGSKVVLTGDGADELFAGYRHYDALKAYYRKNGRLSGEEGASGPLAALRRQLGAGFDPLTVYKCHNAGIGGVVPPELLGPTLGEEVSGRTREHEVFRSDLGPSEAGRRADLASYLPDEILVKVDRATMAFGIEARVPFLDPELVDLAFTLPPDFHDADGRKSLLKEVARAWLPAEVLTARKKGFSAPLAHWFARGSDRRAAIKEEVLDGTLVRAGWLDRKGVEAAMEGFPRPMAGLLQLYLLERWAGRWAQL